MLPVPKGYDEVLKQDYGNNYMTPVKAPSLHSQYGIFIDPESPYVEHIEELRKQVGQRRRKDLKDRILKIFRR